MKKIAIIGAGAVGSTTAYALMLNNTPAEIVLIDINTQRCHGEVIDLNDALFQTRTKIKQATIKEVHDADIIIIAAGSRQKPGQTREELLGTNHKAITSILDQISPIKKEAILLMVTNPLDTLARCTLKISGLPESQVIGSGTFLDSQRLRGLLSEKIGIAPHSIHAYILGEHGDTQFPAYSLAEVGGVPLESLSNLTKKDLDEIAKKTKNEAYEIIECKGATFYGIAACVSTLCSIILADARQVVPVSTYIKEYDIYLSVPVVLGAQGVIERLPISLNEIEQKQFEHSAHELQKLWKHYC